MHAFRRYFLGPLAVMAAIFAAAAAPAQHSPAPHSGVALMKGCPAGTNWDTIKQACI